MDGSIVFARWRQYVHPHIVHPMQLAFALYRCCPLLSRVEYIDGGHVGASAVRYLGFLKIQIFYRG